MSQSVAPNPQADVDRLETAADEAIAACGGDVRDALKALIVANEFLESEVCELMQAVSHAYVRSKPIPANTRSARSEDGRADYVALPFIASDDRVAAGEPTECFNPNAAVMRAEALSLRGAGNPSAARSKPRRGHHPEFNCREDGNGSADDHMHRHRGGSLEAKYPR